MASPDYSKWIPVDDQQITPQQQPMAQRDYSKWEIVGGQPNQQQQLSQNNESPVYSIFASPFRLLGDVLAGGGEFAHNIPKYFEQAKTEVPGVFSTIQEHPKHALKQYTAGLAELGQNIFNTPHDIVNYATNRLHLFPQSINEKIQMARMPDSTEAINQVLGTPQYPGEKLIRGIGRNEENILGGAMLAGKLNPLQHTTKNVAKGILQEQENQIAAHTKRYNKLWEKADNAGINNVPVNNSLINKNFQTIEQYTTPRQHESLNKFMNDKTLSNAQTAQSDLGQLKRTLEERSRTTPLTGEEKGLYNAVSETQKHIEDNMFKDRQGNLNKRLHNEYTDISKSYRENVVPYRYNADIQAYKNKELTAKELVDRLKKGEFAAKKGNVHPELIRNEALRKALMSVVPPGGVGTYLGYKYLFGNKPPE